MSKFVKPIKVNDGSLILPLTRIKTIMKSSSEVENISTDALYYVTKSTVGILSCKNNPKLLLMEKNAIYQFYKPFRKGVHNDVL